MRNMSFGWLFTAVVLMLVVATGAFGQSSASFAVPWSCWSSGGALALTSSSFRVSGTIGQAVAGTSSSTSFKAYLGFWVPDEAVTPTEVGSLSDAKLLADGATVHLAGKIATSDTSDFVGFFYIEDPDRSSGIRVVAASISGLLEKGKTVEVTGKMATTANGERYINNATVVVTGAPDLLGTLGMTNKAMGGGDVGTPGAGTGQYGVTGGAGTNTVGLLVTVWGIARVSGGVTTLDDGSGVPVTVDASKITGLSDSANYSVTGISTLGSGRIRMIMPRGDGDVVSQ